MTWDYDWTDHRGVAHHYPRLFGWHCTVHDRVCSPFTPVTREDLLGWAAKDPTVDDDVFVLLRQALEDRPIDLGGAP